MPGRSILTATSRRAPSCRLHDGLVHLRDRGRRDGRAELGEQLPPGLAERGLELALGLRRGNGGSRSRNAQSAGELRADQIGARGQELAELDVAWAQAGEGAGDAAAAFGLGRRAEGPGQRADRPAWRRGRDAATNRHLGAGRHEARKRQPGGWVTIDDAYNSNPVGFASGLRALNLFREDGGRRILVTPGMVELGSAHDAEHKKIGDLAASCVDVLLPVLPNRIPTLLSAYHAGNPRGKVVPCLNHADAQAWLNANLRAHDAVLVENDLPDLYENRLSL